MAIVKRSHLLPAEILLFLDISSIIVLASYHWNQLCRITVFACQHHVLRRSVGHSYGNFFYSVHLKSLLQCLPNIGHLLDGGGPPDSHISSSCCRCSRFCTVRFSERQCRCGSHCYVHIYVVLSSCSCSR